MSLNVVCADSIIVQHEIDMADFYIVEISKSLQTFSLHILNHQLAEMKPLSLRLLYLPYLVLRDIFRHRKGAACGSQAI